MRHEWFHSEFFGKRGSDAYYRRVLADGRESNIAIGNADVGANQGNVAGCNRKCVPFAQRDVGPRW